MVLLWYTALSHGEHISQKKMDSKSALGALSRWIAPVESSISRFAFTFLSHNESATTSEP